MIPAATLPRPQTPTLDVLAADRDAIDATITALRIRVASAQGRDAFELQRYVDEAVRRRAEVEAEIVAMEAGQ